MQNLLARVKRWFRGSVQKRTERCVARYMKYLHGIQVRVEVWENVK